MRNDLAKTVLRQVKLHYDAIAPEFSQTRQKPWREFEVYRELCKKEAKVLDAGCGNGRLFWQALRDAEISYLGVDISKGLLKEAKKEKSALSAKQKRLVQFKEGSLTKIPALKSSFNLVFCVAAFHHLPSSKLRKLGLKEFRRVLKRDGYLVISVWNLFQKKYRRYLWQAIWRFVKTFGRFGWNDLFFDWRASDRSDSQKSALMRYYHAFIPWEMRALLRNNGFEIIQELWVDKDSLTVGFFKAHNFVWICKQKNIK